MRIGIDARLNAYRHGGIAHYTRQLLGALAPLAPADTFIALQHYGQLRPLITAPNVVRAGLFTPPHHRFEQLTLPLELLPRRLNVVHSPDFIPPFRRSCPAVITVHDLAFIRFPSILDAAARQYYGQIERAVVHADAVIAVSQATRDDIVELLAVPPERIDVVYEAAAPLFRPLALPSDAQRTINGIPLRAQRFILFVSTIEPRKNIATLLRALRVCRDRRPGADYRLVLAGARGWLADPIYALADELALHDAVIFLGGVDLESLHWLYNACRIYVNPSLYEGFGLPVLEALACGAPSLVADTSSLPEVAGAAAQRVPPTEIDAWADAIMQLWHDDAARADLAERGPRQAARFSWEHAAAETLAIYRRVATQR